MKKVFSAVAAVYLGAALSAQAATTIITDSITGNSPVAGAPLSAELATRFTVPFSASSVPLKAEFRLLGTSSAEGITARIYATDAMGNVPTTELALATLPGVVSVAVNGDPVTVTFETKATLAPGNYFISLSAVGNISWLYAALPAGTTIPTAARVNSTWTSVGGQFLLLSRITGGKLDPLPFTDSVVPGLSGARVATLYSGAINDTGMVVNRVRLAGVGVTKETEAAILLTGFQSGLAARAGSSAAVAGAVFESFGDPVISGEGSLAFTAKIRGEGIKTKNDQGLWTDLGGSLVPALREGDPAPALGDGATFQKINWFHLGDNALFIGATARKGSTKVSGVWKWNGTDLVNITYHGDSFALGGQDRIIKTISSPLSIGTGQAQSRIGSPSGRLLLLLTATDGWQQMVQFQ